MSEHLAFCLSGLIGQSLDLKSYDSLSSLFSLYEDRSGLFE
jgi:hypothetical protein